MNIETRYAEIRQEGEDAMSGVLMPYSTEARIGSIRETVEPGAFDLDRIIWANIQHDRTQPITNNATEYLSITDSDKELRVELRYPPNPGGRAAREYVNTGTLTGLSVEMRVLEDSLDGNHRRIKKAELYGLGLVDKPAYPKALISRESVDPVWTGIIPLSEDRQRNLISGILEWGVQSVVSMQRRQAIRFLPGSILTDVMPVTLLQGGDFNSPLASTGAGSLRVKTTDRGMEWSASSIARTSTGNDVQTLLRRKLITGFRVGYVADENNIDKSTVKIAGLDFELSTVREAAMLCDLRLTSDGSGGAGNVKRGRRSAR